jgi:hypothetical protein
VKCTEPTTTLAALFSVHGSLSKNATASLFNSNARCHKTSDRAGPIYIIICPEFVTVRFDKAELQKFVIGDSADGSGNMLFTNVH